MRNLMTLLGLSLLLSGCATRHHITAKQDCALRDQYLLGTQAGSVSSYNSGIAFSQGKSANYSGTTTNSVYLLNCRAPEGEAEAREIEMEKAAATPLVRYNSNFGMKNLGVGTGYFLYILPGIGAKLYHDYQYDKAAQESESIRASFTSQRIPASAPSK